MLRKVKGRVVRRCHKSKLGMGRSLREGVILHLVAAFREFGCSLQTYPYSSTCVVRGLNDVRRAAMVLNMCLFVVLTLTDLPHSQARGGREYYGVDAQRRGLVGRS